MSFETFDMARLQEYAEQAKAAWGDTGAYREFQEKSAGRTMEDAQDLSRSMMDVFAEFGAIRDADPASGEAQALVRKLQDFITAHFYRCTDEILSGLGAMYAAGGEFTENIDRCGGDGTARFASRAIQVYTNLRS